MRATALEAATAALARRDHSAASLAAYLERRGATPDEARDAVARLAAAGYVDDLRVARVRAASLARRGYGDAAVRFDLEERRLDPEAVEAALAGLEAETARARALVARLGATPAAARRLAAKGFSADAIESALAGAVG